MGGPFPPARRVFAVLAAFAAAALAGCGAASDGARAPLALERRIALPDVAGRIDHLAIDLRHGRLFVAELGNGSVDAVDLGGTGRPRRISGLTAPQGVAYLPDRDEVAIASGGDGKLHFFRAADLAPAGVVEVGGDADNLHYDAGTGRLVVGFGSGALAVVDPATRHIVRRIALRAHPEGFALAGDRAIVNLPDAGAIVAADLAAGRVTARWSAHHGANFPLALDEAAHMVAVAHRSPARLVTLDASTGATLGDAATCGDADDVFFDGARRRLFVICGSGAVEMFEWGAGRLRSLGQAATAPGARTGLFVPEQDRLYVAARAGGGRGAEILVFTPAP